MNIHALNNSTVNYLPPDATVSRSGLTPQTGSAPPYIDISQEQPLAGKQTFSKEPPGPPPTREAQERVQVLLASLAPQDARTDAEGLMQLFAKCQQQMRNVARDDRVGALNLQIGLLHSAADKMKLAADLKLAAGIVQSAAGIVAGLVQIGAGAVQIASAGASLRQGLQGASTGKLAGIESAKAESTGSVAIAERAAGLKATAATHQAKAEFWGSSGQAIGQIGAGAGSVVQSAGAGIATGLNYAAELAEVDRTKLETEAKRQETAAQHAQEVMQNAQEIVRDIKDKLSAMEQARSESTRSIARNI